MVDNFRIHDLDSEQIQRIIARGRTRGQATGALRNKLESLQPGKGISLGPISEDKYESTRNTVYGTLSRVSWFKPGKGMCSVLKNVENGELFLAVVRSAQ